MPAAIKSAETAMRIGDPNSAHLNGERLAEVPVDAVRISLAVRAVVTEGLLRVCRPSLSKHMEVIGSCVDSFVVRRHLTNIGHRSVHDVSVIHVRQLPRDVTVGAGKEDGYAAQICRLHVSFDGVEPPCPG